MDHGGVNTMRLRYRTNMILSLHKHDIILDMKLNRCYTTPFQSPEIQAFMVLLSNENFVSIIFFLFLYTNILRVFLYTNSSKSDVIIVFNTSIQNRRPKHLI